jgi:glycosyltransferase involved in cell wall biosynthesis
MLVTNDVSHDTRVRREARALMDAGAAVTIVGVGSSEAADDVYDIRLVKPARASSVRAWMARVIANLCATWSFERRMQRAAIDVRGDVYHCHDLDTLWAGYRVSRRHKAALVYDSHELYLEQPGIRDQWWASLLAPVERYIAPQADMVITVNDAVADELVKRYPIPRPVVVYNGPDRCAVPVSSARPLRVLFQGSFTEGRGLRDVLRAVTLVRGLVHVSLQGFGPLEHELREMVELLRLRADVTFIPPCAPEDTARCSAGYDVGIVAEDPSSLSFYLSSPNKFFSYLGGGLAVLVPDLPVIRGILDEYECGMVVDEMTPVALASALCWLAEHPKDVMRMKQGAARACAEYSWGNQARRLVDAYEGVMQRRAVAAH